MPVDNVNGNPLLKKSFTKNPDLKKLDALRQQIEQQQNRNQKPSEAPKKS